MSANSKSGLKVAGPTRLELATSGVTGRHSNQLNYDPAEGTRVVGELCVAVNQVGISGVPSLDLELDESGPRDLFLHLRLDAVDLVPHRFHHHMGVLVQQAVQVFGALQPSKGLRHVHAL